MDDLRLLIQGKRDRQNFINVLTDTVPNNIGVKRFFINATNGDAVWSDYNNNEPYIGPDGQLIVPTTIIAGKRQILDVGAVRAYQTAGQTFFTGVAGTMTYNTVEFDQDSAMSLGTGIFTPVQEGVYSVTASVGFAASQITADTACSVGIAKNSTLVGSAQGHTSNALFPIVISTTTLVYMDGAGDFLRAGVQQDFGANADTLGVEYACYFTAFKVG